MRSSIYSLHEKCSYSELFWSVFSRIWTEYGEALVSLRIQFECGKIRTRTAPNTDTFYAVIIMKGSLSFNFYPWFARLLWTLYPLWHFFCWKLLPMQESIKGCSRSVCWIKRSVIYRLFPRIALYGP